VAERWVDALVKAERLYPAIEYRHYADLNQWGIKSTTGDDWYLLFKYQRPLNSGEHPWERVGCTCPAGESVSPVCYHKAWLFLYMKRTGTRFDT
jgi:hypothetical protein